MYQPLGRLLYSLMDLLVYLCVCVCERVLSAHQPIWDVCVYLCFCVFLHVEHFLHCELSRMYAPTVLRHRTRSLRCVVPGGGFTPHLPGCPRTLDA